METKKEFLNLAASLTEKIQKSGSVCHLWRRGNVQIVGRPSVVPSDLCKSKRERNIAPIKMTLLLVHYRNAVWGRPLGSYTCSMSAMPSVNYCSGSTAFTLQKT